MSRNKHISKTRILTASAMLTALSVIVGIFCKTYLNFSLGLFRVTFENLPIIMSGILYGPAAGAIVGAASDLVSYMFSTQAYPPNLIVTLGAAASGAVSGVVSHYIVKKKGIGQIIASGASAHVIASMIIKTIGVYQYYGILVLWRIPLYLCIAPVEILIICLLLRRKSFAHAVGYIGDKHHEQ